MPIYDELPTVVVPPLDSTTAPAEPLEEDEIDEVPMVHDLAESSMPDPIPAPAPVPEPAPAPAPPPEPEPEPAPAPDPEPISETEPEPAAGVASEEAAVQPSPPTPLDEDDVWEEADAAPEAPRVAPPRSPAPPGHLPERRVVVIDEDAELGAPSRPSRSGEPEATSTEGHSVADIGATLEDDDGSHKRRWRLFRKGGE
jgi:hypothetical protein